MNFIDFLNFSGVVAISGLLIVFVIAIGIIIYAIKEVIRERSKQK